MLDSCQVSAAGDEANAAGTFNASAVNGAFANSIVLRVESAHSILAAVTMKVSP